MNTHGFFRVHSYDRPRDVAYVTKPEFMKTRIFRGCILGLALSALSFVAGSDQPPSDKPQGINSVAPANPATAPFAGTNSQPPSQITEQTSAVSADEPAVVEPAAANGPLPSNIHPSSPLAEVIKLAQAGVGPKCDAGIRHEFKRHV